MYTWHPITEATIDSLPEGQIIEATLPEKKIALLKKDGAIYSFAATCPHSGAPLCEGWLDAQGRVVCPLHSYRFDPRNGRNTSGEGYKLRTYPVEIREGIIYVGIL